MFNDAFYFCGEEGGIEEVVFYILEFVISLFNTVTEILPSELDARCSNSIALMKFYVTL